MANIHNLKSFPKGQSGNPKGRPKVIVGVGIGIRGVLADHFGLPAAVKQKVRMAVGADSAPLYAIIMVWLLQAFRGDQHWAKLLVKNGSGQPRCIR